MENYISELMAEVKAKNPAEPEFHQAVQEVLESLATVLEHHPEYRDEKILERIIENGEQIQQIENFDAAKESGAARVEGNAAPAEYFCERLHFIRRRTKQNHHIAVARARARR